MSDKWAGQMRKGLAELCVLASLEHEEAYGYAILKRLSAAGALSFTESTVYPVLARLTTDGAVTVRNVKSDSGPVRRYYALTDKGKRRLHELHTNWCQLRETVDTYLGA